MDYKKYLIQKNISIRNAMERLNASKRVLFVVEDDKLIGSLTDGDVRRWILAGKSLDGAVELAMNDSPFYVSQGNKLRAKELINEYSILAVPVLDGQNCVVDMVFWNEKEDEPQTEHINMPVVIMAGGKGERLLPYTSIVPKPLIPIGEKPISELVIDSFKKYGCKEFYFSLNYRKNMIKAYFDDIEKDYDIKYIEEDIPLGTAGGLYYLKDRIDSTFFVSNCDILLDVDYADVLEYHTKEQNCITMVTSLKKYVIPYGTVVLDSEGKIQELKEKPATDYLINTGVYVLEPKVLRYVADKHFVHITEIVENCIADGKKVGAYPISEGAWMDMGQFDAMERMKSKLKSL